jgi:hypothetical protein
MSNCSVSQLRLSAHVVLQARNRELDGKAPPYREWPLEDGEGRPERAEG